MMIIQLNHKTPGVSREFVTSGFSGRYVPGFLLFCRTMSFEPVPKLQFPELASLNFAAGP
jgi:hypothetical protein